MPAIPRNVQAAVASALKDTPIVAINGPRQVGKSTLLGQIRHPGTSLQTSLDDTLSRTAAAADPLGFVERGVGTLVIDEVQLVPALFRAMKVAVDRDRRAGRFLITGSSRLLAVPEMADALVGRVETIDMWPFSQGELERRADRFIDCAFTDPAATRIPSDLTRADYATRVATGGFPEAVARDEPGRRRWLRAYATTIVQRVVGDIAAIERAAELPRIVRLAAARTATELNVTALANDLQLSRRTLDAYLAHLSTAFVLQLVPPWSTNLSGKVVRRPKLHVVDAGLATHLLGASAAALADPHGPLGPMLETFVAMELTKQLAWCQEQPTLFHFRDRGGAEVDLVLEHPDGRLVGIEVKASSSVGHADLRGLRYLAERLGNRFQHGFVLHTGADAVPLDKRLSAVPVSALWRSG
jgi:uncharacterized protein